MPLNERRRHLVKDMFDYLCNKANIEGKDIKEHLPTLRDLASECTHITEMGVRSCVSTWAFVEGLKKGTLISIDIEHPGKYGGSLEAVEAECQRKGLDFTFKIGDTRKIEIEPTELLFIDTDHTYEQLSIELKRHSDKAIKYIVLHDTTSCPDMYKAVEELLEQGKWKIKQRFTNCNGLTILCL